MNLQEILENVNVGETTVFDVVKEAGTGNGKLTVEVRKLLPEEARPPKRAESPPAAHEFYAAESFAAYLTRYGDDNTVIFADPQGEQMYAVMNELEPTGGYEVVTMKPQIHPLWKPWAEIAGTSVPLEKFAQFVAQNRRAIVIPDGKEIALTLSQVRAVVNVTVERGRGKDAVNGLMVTTRIQGVDKKETVELPDEITLSVPLYVGTAKKDVELDLCIEADREGHVGVIVTAGTVAEAKVAAFEEMIAVVREGTKALNATITLGKPKTGAWQYLRELA